MEILLSFKEKRNEKARIRALETVIRELRRLDTNRFHKTAYVLNIGLLFIIAERDIQTVKVDALSHKDPRRRGLSLRVIRYAFGDA